MKKNLAKEKCERALKVVAEIERLTEERKKLYEEHDALVLELEKVSCLRDHGIEIENTFAKGNTMWGHGPVRAKVIRRVSK